MNHKKDKLAQQIENRLQFVITMGIFFLTLLYALSKIAGGTEQSSQISAVSGTIVILGYIIAYVLFAVWGEKIKELGLRWINGTVVLGITCFIVPILFMGLSTTKGEHKMVEWLAFLYIIPFFGSFYGLLIIPIIVILLIAFWPKDRSADSK